MIGKRTNRAGKPNERIMHMRIDPALKRRIRMLAERERRTMTAQVEFLLERALEERETA